MIRLQLPAKHQQMFLRYDSWPEGHCTQYGAITKKALNMLQARTQEAYGMPTSPTNEYDLIMLQFTLNEQGRYVILLATRLFTGAIVNTNNNFSSFRLQVPAKHQQMFLRSDSWTEGPITLQPTKHLIQWHPPQQRAHLSTAPPTKQ
ncbi:hypothetical protein MSG28_011761 [Choristoneura fumiferana]|uniref:Uncharacterized protein n=1 Tax=Choristoneura fumiferana TaxID=7141 RepID=A0ACC0KM99_CHOFU|nr:hypothetical protein MSG28_011761 [Choristoneura fumiferana]